MADRSATCVWEGNLARGAGTTSVASGAFGPVPVTWAARTEQSNGKTSPEELIAAAHASCYCMALSHELTTGGHPPKSLEASAMVTIDRVDGQMTVTTSKLTVKGVVDGIDQAGFQAAAAAASKGCPVSRALGGVKVSLESATLGK
ncbi:MAG TPA: OsmC family peroxiredoxin [Chloroflexota bacterium]|nr:OsmC family peroxiredoxin [Chloroflexota bacterium]